jgi:hypothetical protein
MHMAPMTADEATALKRRVIVVLDDPETRARAERYAQAHRRAVATSPFLHREFTI